MTVTKTFPKTAKIVCSCVVGEITGVADQTIDLGVADSKTVTLSAKAQVTGDCKVEGHDGTVNYTYTVTDAGTTGATVKDRDLIDMTPVESEEVAESESDDIDAFTSDGDESDFTDDTTPESITVDENKTYILTYEIYGFIKPVRHNFSCVFKKVLAPNVYLRN